MKEAFLIKQLEILLQFGSALECCMLLPGALFLKFPIIKRPTKLLLSTCKIEVSKVVHLT